MAESADEEHMPNSDGSDQDAVEETIRLDQFLKLAGVAETGGQAKLLIQAGDVLVNGHPETRRRRQLRPGDEVRVGDDLMIVAADDDEPDDDAEDE